MGTSSTGDAEPETDGWLARYRGLSLQLVLRLARLEQRAVRVVGTDQAVTADWLPRRLTVRVDADGDVLDLRAG